MAESTKTQVEPTIQSQMAPSSDKPMFEHRPFAVTAKDSGWPPVEPT